MSAPMFSILIPTRRRARTLRSAIASVLAQEHDDFELVIMDNAATEESAATVRAFDSPRLVYHASEELLPMWTNWERGLSHCRGEFTFVLGDDDALMPDALRLASQVLRKADLDLLHWQKAAYWWNDAIQEALRGFLFVTADFGLSVIDCPKVLADYYAWEASMADLPCIYSSFVHRSLIEKIKGHTGDYFAACAPDIYSGIAHLCVAQRAVALARPLSLSGNSGASTGTAHFFRSKGAAQRAQYYAEIGRQEGALARPELIPSSNLEIACAEIQLIAKERLFPDDDTVVFQPKRVLAAMIANINRDPASYEDTLHDIFAYATKQGLDPTRLKIPPRAPVPVGFLQGPLFKADGRFDRLAVNAHLAGIDDAHAAARLAAAVIPSVSFDA